MNIIYSNSHGTFNIIMVQRGVVIVDKEGFRLLKRNETHKSLIQEEQQAKEIKDETFQTEVVKL